MDEPTAAISVRQVAEVLNLIRRLRDQGVTVVLISHRMPDVFTVADRVIVLRRGRKVADKKIATSSPEEVTGLITGAIQEVYAGMTFYRCDRCVAVTNSAFTGPARELAARLGCLLVDGSAIPGLIEGRFL